MSAQDSTVPTKPQNRYAKTGADQSRLQLEKLMKDPSKPVVLPTPPKEKTVRAPREMIKNVQGSSAGAGSGEFHVYKASRRLEYERLKLMEDEKKTEEATAENERRKREREEVAEAKTSKNRAKRQKKKEALRRKGKEVASSGDKRGSGKPASDSDADSGGEDDRPTDDQPFKKRRLVADSTAMVATAEDRALEAGDPDGEVADMQEPVDEEAENRVLIHDED